MSSKFQRRYSKVQILSIFVFAFSTYGHAQTISLDQGLFGYYQDQRELGYTNYGAGSATFNTLNYSDTLTRSFDFKLGLGYFEVGETYWSGTPRDVSPAIVFRRLEADYLSINLGVQYWIRGGQRNGLFMESRLNSLFRFSTQMVKTELDSLKEVVRTEQEATEDFAATVFLWANSIGYRLTVYNTLSVEATFGLLMRMGATDMFRPIALDFSRVGSLGLAYRF